MSRALARAERAENDNYQTDPKLARHLVRLLHRDGYVRPDGLALEPSCGLGAFVEALAEIRVVREIHAVDVADYRDAPMNAAARFHVGLFEDSRAALPFDLVLGNPPYTLAEEHVRKALTLVGAGGVVAFLLRLSFLETKQRIPFWKDHPAETIYVLSERPSFTDGGTDSAAYAMFVWRNARPIWPTRLEVISWGGREKAKKGGEE